MFIVKGAKFHDYADNHNPFVSGDTPEYVLESLENASSNPLE